MSTEKKDFTVLIAGGGIAGLTLANMLQKLNINYKILEAYSTMTPQVGASIGMLPNGFRILDQIDLYEDIRALIQDPGKTCKLRAPGGKVLVDYDYVAEQVKGRFSYDVVFVDRQFVLGAMYDKLKNKDQVLVNKRVQEVRLHSDKVEVLTTDGSTHTGDILIGADGVHSKVRSEMWRLADKLEPGWIPASEHTESAITTHKCMFGISVNKTYPADCTQSHMGPGFSYLTIGGPDDKVYWFLFVDMKQTYHLHNLPRFTKDDEAALAKEHAADVLTENFTFGDLYKSKTSSVLTAIPEYVFKKWHYDRIMTIGDASHKFNPISGHGGNSAIESTAVLVNNLHALLQKTSNPTTAEIKAAFAATQAKRAPRVQFLVEASHGEQVLAAIESPVVNLVAKIIPYFNFDNLFGPRMEAFNNAERLEMLPVPKRPRVEPFSDELPAYPLAPSAVPKLITAGALAAIFYVSTIALSLDGASAGTIVHSESTFAGYPLARTLTGYPAIDEVLSVLLVAFSGVAGADPFERIQAGYFLLTLLPILFIWTVESYRSGNYLKPAVTLPVLFTVAAQVVGIGKVAPLYYLLSLATSSAPTYTRIVGRPIPSPVAKALLPAFFLGFLLPTIAIFLPRAGDADGLHTQAAVAVWQLSPVYAAVLTWTLAKAITITSAKPVTPFHLEILANKDAAPLQAGYAAVVAVTALMHAAVVWYASAPAAAARLLDAFFRLPAPGAVRVAAAVGDFYGFFKWDCALTLAAVLVWSLYSVFELRRLGYVTSATAVKAGLAVLAGQVVVGPGATYAALWAWRESVIVSISELMD